MIRPELEAALRGIETSSSTKTGISRHQVRPVLVFIGEDLLAGGTAEAEEALARLARLPERLVEAFQEALRDELAMACTEHIRSADPRYLDHPDYDLDYALEARRRLEARLRAAERLGTVPEDALMGGVRRADALLEPRWKALGEKRT